MSHSLSSLAHALWAARSTGAFPYNSTWNTCGRYRGARLPGISCYVLSCFAAPLNSAICVPHFLFFFITLCLGKVLVVLLSKLVVQLLFISWWNNIFWPLEVKRNMWENKRTCDLQVCWSMGLHNFEKNITHQMTLMKKLVPSKALSSLPPCLSRDGKWALFFIQLAQLPTFLCPFW